jgi:hypothetical protein
MRCFDFQPVIIIGAARSGTNMVRNALTRLPGFATWPCDEINYVWRRGHARFKTDELRAEHATTLVCNYIRSAFSRLARRTQAQWIVEKTCANSLRVDFVREVIPEGKFIFLVRDGRDVVASALKRWRARLDVGYTVRKARFVPAGDVPFYAWRFIRNRANRVISSDKRVASWGPRFEGIDELLANRALAEVCAVQWIRCVERAAASLESLPTDRYCTVRYEDFVQHPKIEFRRICEFLGVCASADHVAAALSGISDRSIGNWRTQLDANQWTIVLERMRPTLAKWGYVNESGVESMSGPGRGAQPMVNRIALACAAGSDH